jgi:3-oxoacyl-[acyl-carrier protein] reductase
MGTMKKLEGKVALVTGAARGIGAAIAERLAADGASVAINYATSKDDAEALAERIRGNGGKAKAIQADIGNPSQAKAFVDAAVKEFGRLDILVNNAGQFHIGPIGTVDEADVRSLFAVNVDGPIFATQAAASYFSTEGGRVINVSSIAATHPLPGLSVYSATKAALDALTRVWAAELGPRGVTVNAVAPGAVDTAMLKAATPRMGGEEAVKGMVARTPLGRLGTTSDVADVVAFLASPDARWVTGQVVEVSGGINP